MATNNSTEVLFTLPIRNGNYHGVGKNGQIVCTQPQEGIYLLTFDFAPDNRLVTPFCHALILALDLLEQRYPRGAVITTSAIGKFYSNGMDLEHTQWTAGYLPTALYAVWRRLLTFGAPTVACVRGHAFAGGAMLAMMHDYRVMAAARGYFCLNELELGLPLRPPMAAVFKQKVAPRALRSLVLEAKRFPANEALKEGIIDRVGGLEDAFALVNELKLVAKAQEGLAGKAVYGELKREMYHETISLLENWAEENVRWEKMHADVRREQEESLQRVKQWESADKSKL